MTDSSKDFHTAMIDLYEVAKSSDYFATYFKQLLDQYGGFETPTRLLSRGIPSVR